MTISKDIIIKSDKGFHIIQLGEKFFSVVCDHGHCYFATNTLRKAQNYLKRQQ